MASLRNNTRRKKAFLSALVETRGVITHACRIAEIPRQTVYDWMNDDEEFKAEAKKVQEVALDFAEEKLFEAMEELNVTALIFYLKTKGKDRGYVERIEQDHKNLERINVVINNPYEPDTDKSE